MALLWDALGFASRLNVGAKNSKVVGGRDRIEAYFLDKTIGESLQRIALKQITRA